MGYQQFEKRSRSMPNGFKKSKYPRPARSGLKRLIDIVGASVGLLFAAPFILPAMYFIHRHDGGPAIFAQDRVGHGGRPFRCYKLRSMVVDSAERLEHLLATDPEARAEWEETQKLRNDPRVTRLGKFLRKSSLDELPQLWNILRGDMSLVGPRPIQHIEIPRYGTDFIYYTDVRPGLTGLWQVSGRSDTSYDERVALDVKYVREWTFVRDVKVIAKTIPAILTSKGAR